VRLAATLYRYLESGHHSDALTIHTRALHAARTADDLSGQAHALTNLGAVHRLLGGYERATDHLQQALALHELTDDPYGTARTLSNLGIVDDRLGRHEAAAQHLRQALVLFRAIDDRYGDAGALTNLGSVEESLGRHESAAEYHRQAYTLFGALGDPWAAEHLGQALVLFRAAGHRYGEASVLNALGEVMHATGRPGDALARYTAALRIAAETGDRDERLRAQRGIDLIGPIDADVPDGRPPVPEGRTDPSGIPVAQRAAR